MLSEAPIKQPDSAVAHRLPIELCGDSTLRQQYHLNTVTPPQRVSTHTTSIPPSNKPSSGDQIISSHSSPVELGKPGLSAFEILIQDLENKGAMADQCAPAGGEGEAEGHVMGRHRDWMNFVTICDHEQEHNVTGNEEKEKIDVHSSPLPAMVSGFMQITQCSQIYSVTQVPHVGDDGDDGVVTYSQQQDDNKMKGDSKMAGVSGCINLDVLLSQDKVERSPILSGK